MFMNIPHYWISFTLESTLNGKCAVYHWIHLNIFRNAYHKNKKRCLNGLSILTSISSLYLSRCASIMLRSLNVSVSTSKVCPVTWAQNHIDLLIKLFISNVKSHSYYAAYDRYPETHSSQITGNCIGVTIVFLTSVILFQWRVIIALLVMSSSTGQHSLNSSIVFFRSKKACHSFRARGSLRHLVN